MCKIFVETSKVMQVLIYGSFGFSYDNLYIIKNRERLKYFYDSEVSKIACHTIQLKYVFEYYQH